MAEIFVSHLLDGIISSIGSAVHKEITVVWGVKDELESISSTLTAINALMPDAEEKQLQSNSIRDWLRKLKDVAYDAEDVVEEFNLEALQAKQAGDVVVQSKKRKKVHNLLIPPCLKKFLFRHQIGNKIQDIRKRLDDIAKERDQFHLSEMSVAKPIQTREGPYTGPLIDASTVIGREEEKDRLIKELLGSNESISEKLPIVIPIIGMGGLGKTTFARLIYNNEEVKQHFEVRGWVCASDRFDWRRVTKKIIESITGNQCEVTHPEVCLQNLVQGKRFLIVIDDVWDDALNYWDDFRVPFIYGDKGSKLLVTTRSKKVSLTMGTSTPFHLVGLSDEDCLKVFLRKAFVNGDEERYPNLVDIGKRIVKECRGVPLAINTLGGLLTFTRSENEWNGVLQSSFWNLPQNENSILPALRLSYHHLPSKVKPCFAFCSLFPKDWQFGKDMLIRMWMALGYIQPDEWREEEDVGNEYFNDLLMRSFFSHHHDKGYIMHDLVHDLAESLAKGECIRLHGGKLDLIHENNNILQKARHASLILSRNAKKVSFDVIKSFGRLRTFVTLTGLYDHEFDMTLTGLYDHEFDMTPIVELNFLHVMRLERGMRDGLPNVIGCLGLLRYLDLSYSKIEELPDSICNLSYLQTLNLEGCFKLKKLPNNTAALTNLMYLNIFGCDELTCMPTNIGKLTNLREFSKFIVGKEVGKKIVELKGLNKLKHSFIIRGLKNVVGGEEAKEAGLKNKQLGCLVLDWMREEARDGSIDEDVLENLQPHINLEGLFLMNYRGTYLPSWLSNLTSLKNLHLEFCSELASLPEDLGKLGSLKNLSLKECPKISSLPRCPPPKSLRRFLIEGCHLLEESCGSANARDWANIAHIACNSKLPPIILYRERWYVIAEY